MEEKLEKRKNELEQTYTEPHTDNWNCLRVLHFMASSH